MPIHSGRVYLREAFTRELFAEMLPLLEAHWREVAHYLDIPLDVDADVYFGAEDRGALRVYTVRRVTNVRHGPIGMRGSAPIPSVQESVLIGYAVFFVRPNPHYSGSVQAVQDVVYVAPDHRGLGGQLIRFADDELRAEGVQAVYHHVKTAHNWGKLLGRMGYEPVDVIWAKRLDRD